MFILLCNLIIDAVSSFDCIRWNEWMTVNNKLEEMGKEAAVAQFKVLIGHFLGGNEENHKT
jgi:hypothetical protein